MTGDILYHLSISIKSFSSISAAAANVVVVAFDGCARYATFHVLVHVTKKQYTNSSHDNAKIIEKIHPSCAEIKNVHICCIQIAPQKASNSIQQK
jgi:hypothetical protein